MKHSTRLSANILFVVTLLFWFAQFAYTSYVNPELSRMGASAVFMGFVSGAYGFTQMVLRVPIGVMADRWKKKMFISIGCLCSVIAALCMLLIYHPLAFLVGRALSGVAAASWVAFTVLYASYFEAADSTKSIYMISVANQAGRMLSFVFAGLFVQRFGSKAAFIVSAAGGLLACVLSLLVYEENDPSRKAVRVRDLLAVVGNRNLQVTSLLTIFAQVVGFATYNSFTANHAMAIGATGAQLSYMNVIQCLPGMVVNYVVSKYLLRRIDPKWLVILGTVLTAVYCGMMPFSRSIMQLYCLQALASIGNTLTVSLLMSLCVRDVDTSRRSAAMGFFQAVYCIGITGGPIVMGFITESFSLAVGFFVMCGVSLATTVMTATLLRRNEPA